MFKENEKDKSEEDPHDSDMGNWVDAIKWWI